ncbi:MAG: GNAT family N-acetyltransferase [Candidatus Njordarchaeales archaeon]
MLMEWKNLIVVRRMTRNDLPIIAEIAHRAFRNGPDSYWAVIGAKRAQRTFVAEMNNKVVGVIEIEIVNLSVGRQGHVGYIFVDPNYQRRGIGTKLLITAENFFKEKGAKASWALTSPENIAAQRLFEKNGYRRVFLKELFQMLPVKDAEKLLRRIVYWEGDIIYHKPL